MTEVAILGVVVAMTGVFALWWRAQEGRVRTVDDRFTPEQLAALDAPAGQRLLVEFTAPSCAPCTAARRVLDEAAASRDDVSVAVAHVGEHLGLARAHGVLRTPTTFVLSADGTILGRIAGVPATADVTALLDAGAERDRRRAA